MVAGGQPDYGAAVSTRPRLLASGKVLAAGGGGAAGYLESAELYDPLTDAWTSANTMTDGRAAHAATSLLDGRVLVEGGVNASATLVTAEIYDPVANAWEAAGTIAAARARHAAVLLTDGGVLIAGGNGASYLNSAELWDADADNDGVPNRHEVAPGCAGIVYTGYAGPQAQMTEPCDPDTDGDGFKDLPTAAPIAVNTDPNTRRLSRCRECCTGEQRRRERSDELRRLRHPRRCLRQRS